MQRILIVEDDSTIVRSLGEFLRGEGFYTDAVSGQREALEKIEEQNYDLALLDVALKDGNGFSVCSAIKQKRDLPVIFLTASGDEFSVVTGLDLGADDYIVKTLPAAGADLPHQKRAAQVRKGAVGAGDREGAGGYGKRRGI